MKLLLKTLDTNIRDVRFHTKLLCRAIDWCAFARLSCALYCTALHRRERHDGMKGKARKLLLSGQDLDVRA